MNIKRHNVLMLMFYVHSCRQVDNILEIAELAINND